MKGQNYSLEIPQKIIEDIKNSRATVDHLLAKKSEKFLEGYQGFFGKEEISGEEDIQRKFLKNLLNASGKSLNEESVR